MPDRYKPMKTNIDVGEFDSRKSLAELTGVDWGPPAEDCTFLMRERLEWHRIPLNTVSVEGLVRYMKSGLDMPFIIREGIRRLEINPDNPQLLYGVLEANFPWAEFPELVHRIRKCVSTAACDYEDLEGSREIIEEANAVLLPLYRLWAVFELNLSSIPKR